MNYPKRKESHIVTAILKYLQVLMNLKKLSRVERLNSGAVKVGNRRVRLCQAGCPDILVLIPDGACCWLEVKREGGKQSAEQIDFHHMIEKMRRGHGARQHYFLVESTDDVVNALSTIGVKCF